MSGVLSQMVRRASGQERSTLRPRIRSRYEGGVHAPVGFEEVEDTRVVQADTPAPEMARASPQGERRKGRDPSLEDAPHASHDDVRNAEPVSPVPLLDADPSPSEDHQPRHPDLASRQIPESQQPVLRATETTHVTEIETRLIEPLSFSAEGIPVGRETGPSGPLEPPPTLLPRAPRAENSAAVAPSVAPRDAPSDGVGEGRAPAAPEITIHIGRIDLREAPKPKAKAPKSRRESTVTALGDYLKGEGR